MERVGTFLLICFALCNDGCCFCLAVSWTPRYIVGNDDIKGRLETPTKAFNRCSSKSILRNYSSHILSPYQSVMINVAVAGGLGNVGKTIVEVLKEDPKYNVIILSRKVRLRSGPKLFGAQSSTAPSPVRRQRTCAGESGRLRQRRRSERPP